MSESKKTRQKVENIILKNVDFYIAAVGVAFSISAAVYFKRAVDSDTSGSGTYTSSFNTMYWLSIFTGIIFFLRFLFMLLTGQLIGSRLGGLEKIASGDDL